ncbi:MAG: prolyl oligopeptidase family serine peptidase [Clostridia bacterium]|nr:prolyl oligopeptidase family serine peptidase [Clostridia bacterium]
MKNKLFKRVLAFTILMVMLGNTAVNAAIFDRTNLFKFDFNSIFTKNDDNKVDVDIKLPNTDIIMSNDREEEKEFLNLYYNYVKNIDKNKNEESVKVDLLNKLNEYEEKYDDNDEVSDTSAKLRYQIVMNSEDSTSGLLDTLTSTIRSLISKIGSSDDTEFYAYKTEKTIYATSAKDNIALHANIYYAKVDENNRPISNKWVLLIHPFMLNGNIIAETLGAMYTAHDYNIIAPDLRGFGDSEGEVAMGYLEALDMTDWLTELNKEYTVDAVIVHGVSLGGATTIQLSGMNLDQYNVIGIVEDCGYTSMIEMAESNGSSIGSILGGSSSKNDPKDYLINDIGVLGNTGADFDTIENGLNSLEKCTVPVLIIHGTDDTMVPYENSDRVYNTVMSTTSEVPYVLRYSAEGESHAFILLGKNEATYKNYVDKLVNKAEEIANTDNYDFTNKEETTPPEVVEEKTSLLQTISKVFRLLKGMLGK